MPVYINVGAGPYPVEGFVNLDNSPFLTLLQLYPLAKPFLNQGKRQLVEEYRQATARAAYKRHDCRRPLPFADNSVDHIYTNHFLEHIYADEATFVLKDFYRVLRPGGIAHVSVPDFGAAVRRYQEGGGADKAVEDTGLTRPLKPSLKYRVLELCGFEGLQHRWMYDRQSLEEKVRQAGFSIVDPCEHPSAALYAPASDGTVHVLGRKAPV